jgi:DNA-binding SARP family transcriptional activator
VPVSTQRVLGFLALHDRDLLRTYVAGALWPDTSEKRAGANLRSALWRLGRFRTTLTESNSRVISLAPSVVVDVRDMERLALGILDSSISTAAEPQVLSLSGELLPGFYDEWILTERERLRQLRLQALETLCERLTARGDHGQAVAAGLAAVAGEPLRESAQSLLIKAHLAGGNRAAAIRQFERYREALRLELDLEPSPELRTDLALPAGAERTQVRPVRGKSYSLVALACVLPEAVQLCARHVHDAATSVMLFS